jgi:hypothetical protein
VSENRDCIARVQNFFSKNKKKTSPSVQEFVPKGPLHIKKDSEKQMGSLFSVISTLFFSPSHYPRR